MGKDIHVLHIVCSSGSTPESASVIRYCYLSVLDMYNVHLVQPINCYGNNSACTVNVHRSTLSLSLSLSLSHRSVGGQLQKKKNYEGSLSNIFTCLDRNLSCQRFN